MLIFFPSDCPEFRNVSEIILLLLNANVGSHFMCMGWLQSGKVHNKYIPIHKPIVN